MLVLVMLAGAVGSACRFVVDGEVLRRTTAHPGTGLVPWGTLAVNVSGSFLLGLLTAVVAMGDPVLLVAGTGFCGGYTTFSTASVETVRLAARGRWREAVLTSVGGAVVCVLAAGAGLALGGVVTSS